MPTSKNSDEQSKDSKEHWHTPTDVKQLAAQVNEVATQVLNNDIDLEKAKLYASLTRNVAQLWSAQVTRARFLRQEPELNFGSDD